MICPKCGTTVNKGSIVCTGCGSDIGSLGGGLREDGKVDSVKPNKEDVKGASFEAVAPESAEEPTEEAVGNVFDGIQSRDIDKTALADAISDVLSKRSEAAATTESTVEVTSEITTPNKPATKEASDASARSIFSDDDALSRDIDSMLGGSSVDKSSDGDSSDMKVSADEIDAMLGVSSADKSGDGENSSDIGVSADDIDALLDGTEMQSDKSQSGGSSTPKKATDTTNTAPNPKKAAVTTGTTGTAPNPKKTTGTTGTTPTPKKSGGSTAAKPVRGGGNLGTVNPIKGIVAAVRGIFNFYGRSSRSEFFWGTAFLFLVVYIVAKNTDMGLIPSIIVIASTIAMTSLTVRRLHDIGKSWVGLWKLLIPYIGWCWLTIQLVFTSSEGRNKWGNDNH